MTKVPKSNTIKALLGKFQLTKSVNDYRSENCWISCVVVTAINVVVVSRSRTCPKLQLMINCYICPRSISCVTTFNCFHARFWLAYPLTVMKLLYTRCSLTLCRSSWMLPKAMWNIWLYDGYLHFEIHHPYIH